jgi:hypothetical protein
MEKIFVIISLEGVNERIRSYIDKGYFNEAQKLSYEIEGFCDHVKSEFQKDGSTVYLLITDRIILECTLAMAETIPLLIDGLKELLKGDGKIACGFGYNMEEASKAMSRSRETLQIELYDDSLHKSNIDVLTLPINNSDPKVHEYKDKIKPKTKVAISGPDAQTELQAQAEYTNAIVQTLMPQQPAAPQEQPVPQDPNAPQPARKSLHELLTGTPAQGEQPQSEPAPASGTSPEDGETEKDESTGGMTPEEKSELDKIGESILSIKENIPHLMDLAERNPKAFKQSVGVINKLLAIAKEKFKKSEGAFEEQELLVAELNKAIQKFHYPIGTVKHRKKKQIVNNRASWRSLSSGQVMDDNGNAISIKSHNNNADSKTDVV